MPFNSELSACRTSPRVASAGDDGCDASSLRRVAGLESLRQADGQVAATLLADRVRPGAQLLLASRRRIHDATDRVYQLRPAILLA